MVRKAVDLLGEGDVLTAWGGVATWMVVDKDKHAGSFPEGDANGIAHCDVHPVEPSEGGTTGGAKSVLPIEGQDP